MKWIQEKSQIRQREGWLSEKVNGCHETVECRVEWRRWVGLNVSTGLYIDCVDVITIDDPFKRVIFLANDRMTVA